MNQQDLQDDLEAMVGYLFAHYPRPGIAENTTNIWAMKILGTLGERTSLEIVRTAIDKCTATEERPPSWSKFEGYLIAEIQDELPGIPASDHDPDDDDCRCVTCDPLATPEQHEQFMEQVRRIAYEKSEPMKRPVRTNHDEPLTAIEREAAERDIAQNRIRNEQRREEEHERERLRDGHGSVDAGREDDLGVAVGRDVGERAAGRGDESRAPESPEPANAD
jgi:hypothetical protein